MCRGIFGRGSMGRRSLMKKKSSDGEIVSHAVGLLFFASFQFWVSPV